MPGSRETREDLDTSPAKGIMPASAPESGGVGLVQEVSKFDLKGLLSDLLSGQPAILEIYLFGSRAYRTGSLRSDCDLIVRGSVESHIRSSELRNFAMAKCPALDFFIVEGARATSCMNDSFVRAASFEELVDKLDAILLWSKSDGFAEFEFDFEVKWVFSTSIDVVHIPTVLPSGHIAELSWQTLIKRAEQSGLPVRPFIGETIDKATAQISDVLQRILMRPSDLGQRGQARCGWTVSLADEYDCQNLFFTVVKPWLPQLEREEVELVYDDQKKISDFSLFEGKLVIELKHVDSDQKKREVIKTLDGLSRFYSRNANVVCLLMVIFVASSVSLDDSKWETDYTFFTKTPRIITKVLRLP
jgi:predicted nucleotidyltransferase